MLFGAITAIARGVIWGTLGGMWLYLRATSPVTTAGKYGVPVLCTVLLATQVGFSLGPPPASPSMLAASSLVSNLLAAGGVYWLEKKRQ